MTHFLGIDVGTSGTKALVVGDDGEVAGSGTGSHEPTSPRGGWSEQDALDWWPSTRTAIQSACRTAGIGPEEIVAIFPGLPPVPLPGRG